MISREPFPWKHVCLWVLLFASGLLTAYIIVLGAISVWVGLSNREEEAFFMPILAGCLAIMVTLWIFFHLARYLLGHMKEKGLLDR